MDYTPLDVVRGIDQVLEKKLLTSSESMSTVGGTQSAVEILSLVDRATEKKIIEALEDGDLELAEEIKARMVKKGRLAKIKKPDSINRRSGF
jgi:flagellar motor switch protein FliG